MNEYKIQWLDVNTLVPYPKNAKEHDERQVANIANSIKRFGWQQNLTVTSDNIIVIGHGRRLAAIALGLKKVPCKVIDKAAEDLTDDDIKELRIADNLTNESPWLEEIRDEEIKGLDFEGFDFDVLFNDARGELQDYFGAERERTYKGVNLKQFDPNRTDGFYQMPIVEPCNYIPDRLIGFNYVRTTKETDCGVHFFIDDYQFERLWNDPETNIEYLKQFQCALTPDWSLYMDMPMAMKVWNVYRSRLIGQLMQDAGIQVIPTLSWAQRETYQFCFDGIMPGGVVAVSTVGVMRDEEAKDVWADGMKEALKRLKPSCVLCYGSEPTFFDWGGTKTKFIPAREWGGE